MTLRPEDITREDIIMLAEVIEEQQRQIHEMLAILQSHGRMIENLTKLVTGKRIN